MRYRGQSYELTVPLPLPVGAAALSDAEAAFHAAAQRWLRVPDETVEAVTLRSAGVDSGQPQLPRFEHVGPDATGAHMGGKPVWFDDTGAVATPCYDRKLASAGQPVRGPAVIVN
ncbi:MAG: hypothetical protein R2851_05400 [Caldilineaceae bacterium]